MLIELGREPCVESAIQEGPGGHDRDLGGLGRRHGRGHGVVVRRRIRRGWLRVYVCSSLGRSLVRVYAELATILRGLEV